MVHCERIEHNADLAVAGDFGCAEQRFAVRPSAYLGQLPLRLQERGGLHKEDHETEVEARGTQSKGLDGVAGNLLVIGVHQPAQGYKASFTS